MKKPVVLFLSALLIVAGFLRLNCHADQRVTDTEVELLQLTPETVTLALTPTQVASGTIEIELYTLRGKKLAMATRYHSGIRTEVSMTAAIESEDPADYYIRYRFSETERYKQRSLFLLSQMLETTILGQREYLAGTSPIIQVIVRDRSVDKPLANAKVNVTVTSGNTTSVTTAVTDHRGQAPVEINLPDQAAENVKLKIEVITAVAKDLIEEVIQVNNGIRTLLTTDKPLYQPGQTIHMRALSLQRPQMKPMSNKPVLFEVSDAKGNKVFKYESTSDKFGVSHADFVLASELNEGNYRIRHSVAGSQIEKTIKVERYVLPKFSPKFKSGKSFYQPGETMKGDIQVDYFFGKPVAGAEVIVSCKIFDVEFVEFQSISGETDANGHFSFEAKLPDVFIGEPLESGKAYAMFEITVIDTADHREQITKNVSITENPLIIAAIPESGNLVPGIKNKIHVVTTYADSTPAETTVTWHNKTDQETIIKTDASGFGILEFLPPSGIKKLTLELSAKDQQGHTNHATINLNAQTGDEQILLRADKAMYQVGNEVSLEVFSTRKTGAVFIDVIREKQTQLTQTIELKNGKGTLHLPLDQNLTGTLEIRAFMIGKNGVIVGDQRIIIVDPANDLSIEITGDKPTHLPGTDATVSFHVADVEGKGVAAALGVIVVDEAVFALQEMQPGLEKIYFYLEKKLAEPRYEIHGFELDDIVPQKREKAAEILLASAQGTENEYALHVNTFERDNKSVAFNQKMGELLREKYQNILKALQKKKTPTTLTELIKDGLLRRNVANDPWGKRMKIEDKGNYHAFSLLSAGIDGQWGTADDISYSQDMRRFPRIKRDAGLFFKGQVDMMMVASEVPSPELTEVKLDEGSGQSVPRIRKHFPETLYFNPALITDENGNATLDVALADSITTWRMTCMASSANGALGSTTTGIRVFQDFFVDIDFPVALTQNDQISVPVVVYNYLDVEQEVKLVVEKSDWFELRTEHEQTIKLAPTEVKAIYFPIVARKVGQQTFTVFGYGTDKSDAIARSVEVEPDGKKHLVTHSGRLEGNIVHSIEIPPNAIADASKIFAKIYPGVLSQIVEGLDNILRMPSGCFEQTSSATYPNILVLDYMKTTGQISPELQMKAESFINSGYQRLLSFEVDGGGFEWFGKAPAHRVLTAYGLMEFFDMSKVYTVDPAVISRTQKWLANCQEKDGSFKPSQGGITEGAINNFKDDVLRTTAYLTWALAYTGYTGTEIDKGVNYLKAHMEKMEDNFTIAMAANALITDSPKDQAAKEIIQKLFERRTEEKDVIFWKSTSETPTHGRGKTADIELTGLAVQALIKAESEPAAVAKAVTFLAQGKDSFGTWHSTQATIQALRAMLLAEQNATKISNAKITLLVNDKQVETITVDASNSDVLQLIDLKNHTTSGENTISLKTEGEGSLLYQITGRYYLPSSKQPVTNIEKPLTITLEYNRTKLETDSIVEVESTVTYNLPGRAKMVVVDLGLPPGFTLLPEKLNKLVEKGTIEKYSVTGRQIIVYLDQLEANKPITISYDLLAKYPLKAKAPKAVVYEYYNPDSRSETLPVELTVEK